VVFVPVQAGLSIWFLYFILGWSAFVGLAIMVLLFPLPGYVAKMIQSVQIARMKKASDIYLVIVNNKLTWRLLD
jgi:hypothetical protein